MSDCIFCRIVAREARAAIVHEDERVVAFKDIHPQAPVHLLIVPREHLESVRDAGDEHGGLLGHILLVARSLADKHGLASRGYRLVTNSGAEAGQTVDHLHVHLLGGRPMRWPPG